MTKLISWERTVYPRISSIAEKITPVILYLLHLLACIPFFFYQRTAIVNGILILELLCFFLLAVCHYRLFRPVWLLILMGLNVLFLPISLLLNGGYGMGIVYLGLVVSLIVFNSISVSRKTFLVSHLTVAIILTFFLGVADRSYYTVFYTVAGNEVNPNIYGILAFACMLHWLCAFEQMRIRSGYRLLGQFCGLMLGGYYIKESNCRTAMLAYIVLLMLLLLAAIVRKPLPPKFRWGFLTCIAVCCLLFTVVYVHMSQQMENIVFLNKTIFSGRNTIWEETFGLLKNHFLFGLDQREWSPSMHNTMLQIWYSLGLIPVITTIVLFGYSMGFPKQVKISRCAQISFIGCLVITFLESSLADPYLYLFFVSFLLSNVRTDSREELR